jgi:hypothetical protein
MRLENIKAIAVTSVKNIGMISEEDELWWSEIEITVRYHSKNNHTKEERLPILGFKQLIKEADDMGIKVYMESESETCKFDVLGMVREIIKKEKKFYDPAII